MDVPPGLDGLARTASARRRTSQRGQGQVDKHGLFPKLAQSSWEVVGGLDSVIARAGKGKQLSATDNALEHPSSLPENDCCWHL
jgi:hypothetical protein